MYSTMTFTEHTTFTMAFITPMSFKKPSMFFPIVLSGIFLNDIHKSNFCSLSTIAVTIEQKSLDSIAYAHCMPFGFGERFEFWLVIGICYCFSHLIGLLSVTWLSFLYKFTRFFIYFLFLTDEVPMLETWDYTVLSVLEVHRPFLYFDLYISLLCIIPQST